jgi:anaerobic magnesium-protoporphyrin IX monomethyl ester cyclase
MRVLLVCPHGNIPSPIEGYPSGALLLLGSMLHEKGHEVSIVQMINDKIDNTGIEEYVRKFMPDIVGITMNTYQTKSAREVSQAVKKFSSQIMVVTGGPHPSALKLDTFRDFPDIDVVVYGEGEETFMEIIDGKSLSEIQGICYGETINPPRPFIQDFDYVPLPNLDLIGGKEGLQRYHGPYPRGPMPSMFIMASRGCFGRCKFCNTPVFWGSRVRTRKPEAIVNEIEWLHRTYGIREIYFQDDTFNANRKWAETVLNLIIERGLNKEVLYRLCFRVNEPLITYELLKLAKRANVWMIFYGTENGNQEMLKSMGKNIKIEEIERAFRMTHEVGIKTITSFLIGNIGETKKTIYDSIALAKRLKPYVAGFSIAIPFPDTVLRVEMKEKGHLLEENYDLYGADRCVTRTDELTSEEMVKLQRYAAYSMLLQQSNIDFIFRPRNIFGVRTKVRVIKEILTRKLEDKRWL